MTKSVKISGGQRRSIQTSCGWKCVGHPQEVNKKCERHIRICKNGCNKNVTIPEYNPRAGEFNGYDKLRSDKTWVKFTQNF